MQDSPCSPSGDAACICRRFQLNSQRLMQQMYSVPDAPQFPIKFKYMEEIWQRCLVRLEEELPAQQFNTWIKPLRLVPQGDRWQLLARNSGARIRSLHPSEYAGDVVKAYQNKSWDSFKRYYHSLDVLMIDDIQFFAGKDRTQEEFFYAFNALIEARRQVIITADRFPK